MHTPFVRPCPAPKRALSYGTLRLISLLSSQVAVIFQTMNKELLENNIKLKVTTAALKHHFWKQGISIEGNFTNPIQQSLKLTVWIKLIFNATSSH